MTGQSLPVRAVTRSWSNSSQVSEKPHASYPATQVQSFGSRSLPTSVRSPQCPLRISAAANCGLAPGPGTPPRINLALAPLIDRRPCLALRHGTRRLQCVAGRVQELVHARGVIRRVRPACASLELLNRENVTGQFEKYFCCCADPFRWHKGLRRRQ